MIIKLYYKSKLNYIRLNKNLCSILQFFDYIKCRSDGQTRDSDKVCRIFSLYNGIEVEILEFKCLLNVF